MPGPALNGQIRAATISVPVGLLLLVGGGAAVALGQRALGGALIALAVISVVTGWIIMVRAKNAGLASIRAEQVQRAADVDRMLRGSEDGPDHS